MALSSPRADNLSIICDLVFLISRGKISDIKAFQELTTTFRVKGGYAPWKKTRQYHYISALRDLKLVDIRKSGIILMPEGRELAELVDFGGLERRELNKDEKAFLRDHLRSYSPFVSFLGKFLVTSKEFESYQQLLVDGGVVIFEKDDEKLLERLIKPNGESEPLPKARIYEIKWTLKNWCKDLDLIDEVFLERGMENIGERHRRVFFPLKIKLTDLSLDDFRSRIDYLLMTKLYKENRVRIPLVMYDFCTTYFLSIKGFHYLLSKLYQTIPNRYRLEKISSVYIDERPHRVNGYTNYPKIDDCYRYSLVVR